MKKVLFALLLSVPLVFSSCSDDDDDNKVNNEIRVNKSNYTLNYKDQAPIEAVSELGIFYLSENEYIAKVSLTGIITAGKVGETVIKLTNGKDSKNVNVNVEPLYNMYPEPTEKVNFGDSKAKVKSVFGNPTVENSNAILYSNYHSFYTYMFLFDSNGNVESMAVSFDILETSDLDNFLIERYQEYKSKYLFSYTNEKQDMLILGDPTNDYSEILVMYILNTKSAKNDELKNEFESIVLQLK